MATKRSAPSSNVTNAILYIVIGILFCIFKNDVLGWMMTIAGILFIVFGVLDLSYGEWLSCAVNLIIGVAILAGGWYFTSIVLLVFGILIAVKGALALITAIKKKKKNFFEVLFALITMIAGVLLIVSKWVILDLFFLGIGIVLIVNGLISLARK